MSINLTSTTDSNEQVTAALGGQAKDEKAVDQKESASALVADETTEESDASETDESKDSESEEESEQELEAKDGDKPKKKKGFKKRIDKLTKRLSEKEKEAEYWRQEALKKAQSQESKPDSAKKEADLSAKPKSEDFSTHEEYVEALTEWKVEKKLKDKELEDRAQAMKKESESKVSTFKEKVTAFKADHEDFDEVLEDVDDIPMPTALQKEVLESDNGPELLYALAKNREEYERICALKDPQAIARAFGRFEAKLSKDSESPKETKTKNTKAPPPLTPVGAKGKGSTTKSIYDPDLSQREYEKLRAAQAR